MDNRLNNLGLCNRAGGIICGCEEVCNQLRNNKIHYIFLASDASDNTKKRINDKSKFYNVEVCSDFTSDMLSQAVGKVGRMVIGITNPGFLKILKK